ncbi:Disease resistance-responsive (dirigent-like protein) family protein [Euphorbia peplus]|nr:Disease resistance-responsive (dirigent-like protein) family protein [Euphorbia peplus]
MTTHNSKIHTISYFLFLILTIAFTASARSMLDEPEAPAVLSQPIPTQVPVATQPNPTSAAATLPNPTTGATTGTGSTAVPNSDHALTFFMHDILGGSNPTARAVTGVVNNPAINGQVPFAKPNGAVLPVNNGVPQNNNNNGLLNNNNLPFLTGLSGTTPNVVQTNNNGFNNNGINFPVVSGNQLPSTPQMLMFGTMTVIDDELTAGSDLKSQFVGRAQGFYVASSVDGTSQVMMFTVMFQDSHYEDSLSFFGVHRTAVSESQLAIMGGTGKYVNAQGYAIVKTFSANSIQHETDGIETLLEFTVYITY